MYVYRETLLWALSIGYGGHLYSHPVLIRSSLANHSRYQEQDSERYVYHPIILAKPDGTTLSSTRCKLVQLQYCFRLNNGVLVQFGAVFGFGPSGEFKAFSYGYLHPVMVSTGCLYGRGSTWHLCCCEGEKG